jgi:hypothetical protein
VSDGIVSDGPLSAADLAAAIDQVWERRHRPDRHGQASVAALADDALDALATLTGCDQEGVATALRLYRSGLCGALETADAIAAERDALRDEVKTWRSRTDYVLRFWADHEERAALKARKDWGL